MEFQEARLCAKWRPQLAGEAVLPAWIKELSSTPTGSVLTDIILYDYIRIWLGQPFNRYAWKAFPPAATEEYSSPRYVELGGFYSAVARIFVGMRPPSEEDGEEAQAQWQRMLHSIHGVLDDAAVYWVYLQEEAPKLTYDRLVGFLEDVAQKKDAGEDIWAYLDERREAHELIDCLDEKLPSRRARGVKARVVPLGAELPESAPIDMQLEQIQLTQERLLDTPSHQRMKQLEEEGTLTEGQRRALETEALAEVSQQNPHPAFTRAWSDWQRLYSGKQHGRTKRGIANALRDAGDLRPLDDDPPEVVQRKKLLAAQLAQVEAVQRRDREDGAGHPGTARRQLWPAPRRADAEIANTQDDTSPFQPRHQPPRASDDDEGGGDEGGDDEGGDDEGGDDEDGAMPAPPQRTTTMMQQVADAMDEDDDDSELSPPPDHMQDDAPTAQPPQPPGNAGSTAREGDEDGEDNEPAPKPARRASRTAARKAAPAKAKAGKGTATKRSRQAADEHDSDGDFQPAPAKKRAKTVSRRRSK
jgi:hypothetical protein